MSKKNKKSPIPIVELSFSQLVDYNNLNGVDYQRKYTESKQKSLDKLPDSLKTSIFRGFVKTATDNNSKLEKIRGLVEKSDIDKNDLAAVIEKFEIIGKKILPGLSNELNTNILNNLKSHNTKSSETKKKTNKNNKRLWHLGGHGFKKCNGNRTRTDRKKLRGGFKTIVTVVAIYVALAVGTAAAATYYALAALPCKLNELANIDVERDTWWCNSVDKVNCVVFNLPLGLDYGVRSAYRYYKSKRDVNPIPIEDTDEFTETTAHYINYVTDPKVVSSSPNSNNENILEAELVKEEEEPRSEMVPVPFLDTKPTKRDQFLNLFSRRSRPTVAPEPRQSARSRTSSRRSVRPAG